MGDETIPHTRRPTVQPFGAISRNFGPPRSHPWPEPCRQGTRRWRRRSAPPARRR
jgi:hypothetical protein